MRADYLLFTPETPRRPYDGDHNQQAAFDIGALESHNNRAPTAKAGSPQTVSVGATVQLDGSGSTDPDGDPLCYEWSFVSKPPESNATLPGGCIANAFPTFVADRNTGLDMPYRVQLRVFDGYDWSLPDTVDVSTLNSRPTADAGDDQSIHAGQTVQLDGSRSSDSDGDTLLYCWLFVTLPPESTATLPSGCVPDSMPTFVADRPGTYTIQLTVTDGIEPSEPDEVNISSGNTGPVADAGPDQQVQVGQVVQLDGSGSTDDDGDPLCHRWSFTSRPESSTATLPEGCIVRPTFVADQSGQYIGLLNHLWIGPIPAAFTRIKTE